MGKDALAAKGSLGTLGWITKIPVSYRDEPLCYFTPHPFSELATRLHISKDLRANSHSEVILASLLASAITPLSLSLRRRYVNAILGRENTPRMAELCQLASDIINQRNVRMRDGIVYAGAPGSSSSTLFALEDKIEYLMQDYCEYTTRPDLYAKNPTDIAILTMSYILLVHPFQNGNGRISRFLAIAQAAKAGSSIEGAVVAALQKINKEWFFQISRNSRSLGFDYLLRSVRLATHHAKEKLHVISTFSRDLATLLDAEPEQKKRLMVVLSESILMQRLSNDFLRRSINCSERKAGAFIERVMSLSNMLDYDKQTLTISFARIVSDTSLLLTIEEE